MRYCVKFVCNCIGIDISPWRQRRSGMRGLIDKSGSRVHKPYSRTRPCDSSRATANVVLPPLFRPLAASLQSQRFESLYFLWYEKTLHIAKLFQFQKFLSNTKIQTLIFKFFFVNFDHFSNVEHVSMFLLFIFFYLQLDWLSLILKNGFRLRVRAVNIKKLKLNLALELNEVEFQ